MGGRWNHGGFQLHKVSLVLFMIFYLKSRECLSINLEGWALLKFRSKVDVDPYGALKNWNPDDSDPCNWTGVQCVDGKVESLILKKLSLGGMLAPELGKLQNLKSLVLCKNNFSGVIPNGFKELTMLQILDLKCNKLKGAIPVKIREMSSLKHLLLRDNMFQGPTPSFKNLEVVLESKCECHHSFDMATSIGRLNRKIGHWFKFKRISSLEDHPDNEINLSSFPAPCGENNMQSMKFNRRKLLQENSNLPAAAVTGSIPQGVVPVPAMGSGSFPAVPNYVNMNLREQSLDSLLPKYAFPSYIATNKPFVLDPTGHIDNETMASGKSGNWIYIMSLLAAVLACAAIISSIVHHRQDGVAIVAPWKTGLSGQLQKALISGVTKLNRIEVEVACEDFSNIINTNHECIIFKGTLSSGVEIAVVSTMIASSKDWSRGAELLFHDKIDALSKINHKNFVNLLGYCSEDNPFMRMMVYEYAPNGTLFEHLHVQEFEHLDWAARMRIIMGIAYCLQFMHHELYPPITIPELQSRSIYLTDDYAAKIFDTSIWKEVAAKRSKSADGDLDPSESPDVCSGSNVYSFGILLLEIISGKLSYSEEHGSILHWGTEFLNDKHNIKYLVDQSLKSFKKDELEAICEVIDECVCQVPEDRPTMKKVTARLRNALGILPDAAMPRLSPLWWAELEILSL